MWKMHLFSSNRKSIILSCMLLWYKDLYVSSGNASFCIQGTAVDCASSFPLVRHKNVFVFFLIFCPLQYCKKVWLGLWNSSTPAEPESRDEQKIKDFMVQKYERKRWYMPPQQATANNTSQSAPEPKPLKQLLGENAPSVTVQVS